jgi:hypothetical protein
VVFRDTSAADQGEPDAPVRHERLGDEHGSRESGLGRPNLSGTRACEELRRSGRHPKLGVWRKRRPLAIL